MEIYKKVIVLVLTIGHLSCDLILPKDAKIPVYLNILALLGTHTSRPELQITSDGITMNSGSIYTLPVIMLAQKKTLSFVVKNQGDLRLTIKSLTLKDNSPSLYIKTYNTKAILEPGDSDLFEVEYAPTNYGSHYGMLVLDTNDERKRDFALTFSGSVASPVAPIGVVGSITHTVQPNSDVDLFWGAVPNASTYIIMRGASIGGPYANMGETASLSFTVYGSAPGSTWYYQFVAKSAGGILATASSPYTVFIPVSFFPNAPQPTNFNASLHLVGDIPIQVLFTWDATPNADYYRIYFGTTPVIPQLMANLLGQPITNSYVYTVQPGDHGVTYYYQLYPYNVVSSQGVPTPVISQYISLSIVQYDNVTWDTLSGYSNVSYDTKNGYDNFAYQIWQDVGYTSAGWSVPVETLIEVQGCSPLCMLGGGGGNGGSCAGYASNQWVTNISGNAFTGGSREVHEMVMVPTLQTGLIAYNQWCPTYCSNVGAFTNSTWYEWGFGNVPYTNSGIINGFPQATGDAYFALPGSYNVLPGYVQNWTTHPVPLCNLATALPTCDNITYTTISSNVTVGNWRWTPAPAFFPAQGLPLYSNIGNQGTKSPIEWQSLIYQRDVLGTISNLTGTPVFN